MPKKELSTPPVMLLPEKTDSSLNPQGREKRFMEFDGANQLGLESLNLQQSRENNKPYTINGTEVDYFDYYRALTGVHTQFFNHDHSCVSKN